MKDYDLIIITSNPFPLGLASTNRITTYAKEIAQTHKVLLLTYACSQHESNSSPYIKGSFEGIDYLYLRPRDPKRKSFITKFYYRIITYIRFYFFLLFVFRTQSIITYFNDLFYTRSLFLISKIRRIPIYRDITETFEVYFKSNKERKKNRNIQRLYDGLIVLTKGIQEYFEGVNSNTFILPMGVDISRFDKIISTNQKYFFYCSGGVLERDGLLDSINGFLLFHQNYPDYSFKIATPINPDDSYHCKVMDLIQNNPCIDYLGIVSSDKIPSLMMGASGLVVTPHHDYITKGFPTKLGEYMASKKPVICTSIPSLKENIPENCCYMVEPNRPDKIAETMSHIINNEGESTLIGERGRKFVESKYTVTPYLNDLIHFIQVK